MLSNDAATTCVLGSKLPNQTWFHFVQKSAYRHMDKLLNIYKRYRIVAVSESEPKFNRWASSKGGLTILYILYRISQE